MITFQNKRENILSVEKYEGTEEQQREADRLARLIEQDSKSNYYTRYHIHKYFILELKLTTALQALSFGGISYIYLNWAEKKNRLCLWFSVSDPLHYFSKNKSC